MSIPPDGLGTSGSSAERLFGLPSTLDRTPVRCQAVLRHRPGGPCHLSGTLAPSAISVLPADASRASDGDVRRRPPAIIPCSRGRAIDASSAPDAALAPTDPRPPAPSQPEPQPQPQSPSGAPGRSSGRARTAPAGRSRAAGPGSPPARRSVAGSHPRPRRRRSAPDLVRTEERRAAPARRSSTRSTPSSRTWSPRTSGRASSRAVRQIGSVRSVGSAQGPLSGDRPEGRVADLHLDRRGADARCPQAARRRPRPSRGASARSAPDRSCRRRRCARGRSTSPPRGRRPDRRRCPAPARPASRRCAEPALDGGRIGRAARSPIVVTPSSRERGRRLLADAPQPADRQGREEGRLVARLAPRRARRACAGPRRSWPRASSSATPTDAVSPTSSSIAAPDRPTDRLAVAEQRLRGGHVEERLVDRDRLDERGEAAQDRHHLDG